MAFSLSNLPSKAEIQADLAKVDAVVDLVAKYDGLIPLPATVKTGISDLDQALKFAESVVDEV